MYWSIKVPLSVLAVSFGCLLIGTGVRAAGVKDSLDVVTTTNNSAAASQQKIDDLSRETRNLLEDYRKLLDGSEYEAAYTRELEELEQLQEQQWRHCASR